VILVANGLKAEVEEHVASGDLSPSTKKKKNFLLFPAK
jgi:hypothetical protein